MAKKKLTLEDVLVPKDEIPYEVPENWCWVKYDSIIENLSSSTKKIKQKEYLKEGIYPVIDQGSSLIGGYTNDENLLYDGELPVIIFGDHTRCVKYVDFKFAQGADGVKVLKPKGDIDIKYIYYLMLNLELPNKGYSRHYKFLREAKFQIPPLAEQERIVNMIESLFDKVDKAAGLVDEARDGFEKRRAAILERAFSGELTKKWREENGVSDVYNTIADELRYREEIYKGLKKKDKPNFMNYNIDSVIIDETLPSGWVKCEIGLLCDCIVPGRDKPKSFTGDTPWITIPNLIGDYVGVGNSDLGLSESEIEAVKAKVIPKDSVVMSCVGRFGISSIVKDECVINQQLHAFLPSNLILPKYLMYHIRILKGYMKQTATSTTVAYLNKNNCNSLTINLSSIEEQREIVKILDSVLSKESELEYLTDISERIDRTKKSILTKAFRGELGSNNLDEESSMEIAKIIIGN